MNADRKNIRWCIALFAMAIVMGPLREGAEACDDRYLALDDNSQEYPVAALPAGSECVNLACRDSKVAENRVAVLYANSRKGDHYFAPVTINGRTAEGLIDTGATTVAMSASLAKMFGIDTSQGKSVSSLTANGMISTMHVVVPLIEIAGIEMRDVPVSVGISSGILIGMSFLRRVNVSMSAGTLTMTKRQ